MKNNKFNPILLLPFLLLVGCGTKAQVTKPSDTAYLLVLRSKLDNGRPIVSEFIYSKFDAIKQSSSRDSFLCAFFNQTTLIEEPNFTLSNNVKKYGFVDKATQQKFMEELSMKIDKLSKNTKYLGKRTFSNGSPITIDAVKVVASYWEIPTSSTDEINSLNHGFTIDKACYPHSFIYNIKDIVISEPLTKAESNQLKKMLALQ